MQSRTVCSSITQGHIPWNRYDGNTATREGGLNPNLEDAWHLLRNRDLLAVMAALRKKMFWIGFLKIAAADFNAGNLRGDGQHRNTAAVAIIKTVDQMEVAGTAASGAHGKLSRKMGFRSSSECRSFFVAHVNPLN